MKRATAYIGCNAKGVVISIHALVKRATFSGLYAHHTYQISIHALVKRATDNLKLGYGGTKISIHALVKRATFDFGYLIPDKQFQSTPS